jgi:hypothetical protein
VKGDGPEGDGTNAAPFSDAASPYYGMTTDYVYRYGTATGDTMRNGSMVAIGYFSLIADRHFGASNGDKFTINGDQFEVTAPPFTPPPDTVGGYTPDLEILGVKNLTHPNRPLPGFYQVRQTAPSYLQKAVIVGAGYAGTITGSGPYVPREVNTTTQIVRWGKNQYDTTLTVALNTPIQASTEVLRMLFDEIPDSGPRISTDCYYGSGDSGGGVFFKNTTTQQWELGGINLYVDGELPYSTYAASLYNYKTWIKDVLANEAPEPGTIALLAAGAIWVLRRRGVKAPARR